MSGTVDWSDPTSVADLGAGWTIAACEGDAPLLCVSHDGRSVGVVESLRFPIASADGLDPAADKIENLRTLAAEFLEWVRSDRDAGCPGRYDLSGFDSATLETVRARLEAALARIPLPPRREPSRTSH